MVCGGGGSLEGESESVWWSVKEKEKERGKQWRRKPWHKRE